jgi:3-methyl-2-oxobutanoate hydroxymethyltransferase
MALSVRQIQQYKVQGRSLVALTAWDYTSALLVDQAGVDLVLVGDSLAMVALGHANTLPLTLEEMIHHAKAVRRGVTRSLLVCDLPFLTYQESIPQAIASAGRVLKETGCQAVKLEGGHPALIEKVGRLVEVGIPVMGHLGLTPQSLHVLGLRQQAQDEQAQVRLLEQALALEQAGAFAIVLEHIPADLGRLLSQKLTIPTIGIGAGPDCDGQVLVTADVLGLTEKRPPFAKAYGDLRGAAIGAMQAFAKEVREGTFRVGP